MSTSNSNGNGNNNEQKGYKILTSNKLGKGAFGEIYECIDLSTNQECAVKIESAVSNCNQLHFEAKVMRYLKGGIGIPNFYSFHTMDNQKYLFMELLGKNIETLAQEMKFKFSMQFLVFLIDQMLLRIEFLHSKNFVHRDIKPENFLLGRGKNERIVYLIDYGISKQYCKSHTNEHIEYKEGKSLIGTPRYASINSHLGVELSRRDDLESLAYCIIYLWTGSLPWIGIIAKREKDKQRKILEMKMGISEDELCNSLPDEFIKFFRYVKSLNFAEKPDYKFLHGLLDSFKLRPRETVNKETIDEEKRRHSSPNKIEVFI